MKISSFFLVLSFYNFVYPIRLKIIPYSEYFLYIIFVVWAIQNYSYVIKFFKIKKYKTAVYISLILMFLGFVSSLVNNGDYGAVFQYFKLLFSFSVSLILIAWNYKLYGEKSFLIIVNWFIIFGLVIALSNILEFYSYAFKMLLVSIIDTTGNTTYEISYRTHGFASSGGASLSVGIMLTGIMALFMNFITKKTVGRILYFIYAAVIILSLLVVGRTGLLLGLFSYTIILVFQNTSLSNIFVKLIAIFLAYIAILYLMSAQQGVDYDIIYEYGMEPVYNLINYGKFESSSSNAIIRMYYFPDFEHFILGAGFWKIPTYNYILSDVGYFKILMSTGIIGFLIFYLYQLHIYYKAYMHYSGKYGFKIGLFILFMVLFIAEAKEEFFTQNYGFKMLMILIVYSWISEFNGKSDIQNKRGLTKKSKKFKLQ